MKQMTLRNYNSVNEFIEAVENADTWDAIPAEDYEEALEKAGLNYHDYDDPDEMWDDFMKSVNKQEEKKYEA